MAARIRWYLSWRGLVLLLGIIVVAAGTYHYLASQKTQYQFATVTRGAISEQVSVTGNTVPVGTVSLAFENAGTIAKIYKNVGDSVAVGDVIAKLDTSSLEAQLAQAQAAVGAAQAKLDGLRAGARTEDIQVSQAQLSKAQQDLANMYTSVPNTLVDAYTKSADAVRTQLSSFFSNPDSSSVQMTFSSSNSQASADLKSKRPVLGTVLDAWQSDMPDASASTSTLDASLKLAASNLMQVQDFLHTASLTANTAVTPPPGVASADVLKASATTAANETNTALTAVNTLTQNISSQKILVQQLQAALALKVAGASADDIAAQQAAVQQAAGSVQDIQARIAKSSLTAPIAGVVTVQNGKAGQIASPSAPLVTIISQGDLEIDAYIPEADIGKVAVGNNVTITLDAFQGESFDGKVFFIDPAETIQNGVVDYKVKVSFVKPDARIKSGLTANLSIETKKKDAVLVLPQYAVIQSDQGAYVKILEGGVATQTPVTLGIQDQSGSVEVTSGVSEGDQVIVVGLKSSSSK